MTIRVQEQPRESPRPAQFAWHARGRSRWLGLALPLALLIHYLLLAFSRRIDADEGYFLYAARLVQQGQTPYADFFFPQLPLIPYLWGGALKLFGLTWPSARILAALLAAASALVFWRLARRGAAHPGVALGLLAAYLTSDAGLEWAAVVKVYTPATLFLMLAWLCGPFSRSGARGGWSWVGLGFFSGLALLTRLTVLPVLGLLALAAFWHLRGSLKEAIRPALWYCAGLLPSAAALLWLWALAPHAFLYDNWIYHSLGKPYEPQAQWTAKLRIVVEVTRSSPLWMMALGLIAWDAWRRRGDVRDWFLRLAFLVTVVVCMLPQRSYHQYYCLATPWLLLAAAPALAGLWRGAGRRLWVRRRGAALGVGLVAGVLLLVQPYLAMERRWPQFTWRPRTPEAKEEIDYRLRSVRAVSRQIDALAPPGAKLLAWWPGYALESHVPLMDGLSNHFTLRVGRWEADQTLARRGGALHTMAADDVRRSIEQKEAGIVVTGVWAGQESWIPLWQVEKELMQAGYHPAYRIGAAGVFIR